MVRSAQKRDPIPGTIDPDESLQRGWYPHESQFKWPAPRVR